MQTPRISGQSERYFGNGSGQRVHLRGNHCRSSTASLTAVLGEVLIYLDPRLFAPAVNPPGLVKGVDECFDFVAGLSQLLNGFAKLTRSGGVLVQ